MSEYYKTSDARTLEPYFSRHMMAMTTENLDSKADIAMELAERDQRIALLEAEIERLRGLFARIETVCYSISRTRGLVREALQEKEK